MTNVYAVHLPSLEIAVLPVKQALPLIRNGRSLNDLINYVPTVTTKPLVFFVTREAAEKFIELCRQ